MTETGFKVTYADFKSNVLDWKFVIVSSHTLLEEREIKFSRENFLSIVFERLNHKGNIFFHNLMNIL